MSIIDSFVNAYIDAELIRENKERDAKHTSSGKLSASMLYQPVRFQVLKTLGAPRKEFDAYTLAKFKRGRDVEEWYVEQLRGAGVLIEDVNVKAKFITKLKTLCTQTIKGIVAGDDYLTIRKNYENNLPEVDQDLATYRGCIGYIDSVIDTDKMQAKVGIIPNEIKSVTNMKLRRVKKTGIDWHYKIQACLYALAMGTKHYAVTIVSSEDLRSDMQIFKTEDMKKDVDHAIGQYMIAKEKWSFDRSLPKFEANDHVKWTGDLKYAMFLPEWAENPDFWVIKQLEEMELI